MSTSIHWLSIPLICAGPWGRLTWSEWGAHPGEVTTLSQGHIQRQTTLTFTLTKQFRVANPPIVCMSLGCGMRPENTVRTQASTGRTCTLHPERPQAEESDPETSVLRGNNTNHSVTVLPMVSMFSCKKEIKQVCPTFPLNEHHTP